MTKLSELVVNGQLEVYWAATTSHWPVDQALHNQAKQPGRKGENLSGLKAFSQAALQALYIQQCDAIKGFFLFMAAE